MPQRSQRRRGGHARRNDVISGDDVKAARVRFKGTLQEAIECDGGAQGGRYTEEEEDGEEEPMEDDDNDDVEEMEAEEEVRRRSRARRRCNKTHKPNAYVMKLYDRSVDLAPYTDDTPLYPICRAWMANSPRIRPHNNNKPHKHHNATASNHNNNINDVKLPPPDGYPVSRVPPLLPEQCTPPSPDVFLTEEDTPPTVEALLKQHLVRWHAIRNKWLEQSVLYESRYANTQDILNEINVE